MPLREKRWTTVDEEELSVIGALPTEEDRVALALQKRCPGGHRFVRRLKMVARRHTSGPDQSCSMGKGPCSTATVPAYAPSRPRTRWRPDTAAAARHGIEDASVDAELQCEPASRSSRPPAQQLESRACGRRRGSPQPRLHRSSVVIAVVLRSFE